ncbi:MAG: prolyl oligopeptidase family serine peptidase [Caldilineaceae bacterium]
MKPFLSEISITKTTRLGYLLHLPASYGQNPDQRWPLILFLHGYGESGNDVEAVRRNGLPSVLAQQPDFPFIVVAPQCPWHTWWPELADSLDALLDEITQSYAVDPQRVYLTGLSMGGYGAWYLGSTRPQRFAAIAPICGGGYWFHGFPDRVAALKDTPVWTFHGAKDDVVPLSSSEQLVETLRANGGNVRFTVYPEAMHDSWTVTYNNPELYSWLLEHQRSVA